MKHTNRQINSRNKCSHAANSGFAADSEFVHHNQQQHSAALYAHHYNEHNHILTISMQDKTDNITNITTISSTHLHTHHAAKFYKILTVGGWYEATKIAVLLVLEMNFCTKY